MKALACPQCGAIIKKISDRQTFAECEYCHSKILVPKDKIFEITDEQAENANISREGNKTIWKSPFENESGYQVDERLPYSSTDQSNYGGLYAVMAAIAAVFFVTFIAVGLYVIGNKSVKKVKYPTPTPYKTPPPPPTPEKDERVLLEFGGKGTGSGLFENPREIAVNQTGIYVSDDTKRVQRFDANGNFLNLWNVSGTKKNTIDKLAADAEGNVYVLIEGKIIVYRGETGERKSVIGNKNYIHDFILRDDGGMMMATENYGREEIIQTGRGNRTARRLVGIHSRAAETDIPPHAVRLAVDGAGDIFAVYALGDVFGSYYYNDEDLMTFHFTAAGKFVNKFAPDLTPSAITVDNQSRLYILSNNPFSGNQVAVFSGSGNKLESIGLDKFDRARALTLDSQNNIYLIVGDKVRKLKALDF